MDPIPVLYNYGGPIVSPAAPARVYAVNNNTILRSNDAGAYFKAAGKPTSYPEHLAASTTGSNTLYADVRSYPEPNSERSSISAMRSDDAGVTWTQVFQRLELQFTANKVTIGHLGGVAYNSNNDQGQFIFGIEGPLSNQISDIPMPDDSARYYRDHGGKAFFGRPLSGIFTDTNHDGTSRTYSMQLFDNARIEQHPERSSARYVLQLGLHGRESLSSWGWMV